MMNLDRFLIQINSIMYFKNIDFSNLPLNNPFKAAVTAVISPWKQVDNLGVIPCNSRGRRGLLYSRVIG